MLFKRSFSLVIILFSVMCLFGLFVLSTSVFAYTQSQSTPDPNDVATISAGVNGTATAEAMKNANCLLVQELSANASFEITTGTQLDHWEINDANGNSVEILTSQILDKNSQGNNGTNSIHLLPKQSNGLILLGDYIPVKYNTVYKWSAYVKSGNGVGDTGFYMDEYDANKGFLKTLSHWIASIPPSNNGIINIAYQTNDPSVSFVRLHMYTGSNVTFDIYVDSVSFVEVN